jgi:hypothetical protein
MMRFEFYSETISVIMVLNDREFRYCNSNNVVYLLYIKAQILIAVRNIHIP